MKNQVICFTIIILSLISSLYAKCILSDDPTTTEKSKITTEKLKLTTEKSICPPCVCKN
jgi:hypothetical protein